VSEITKEAFQALVKEWNEWGRLTAHCSAPVERGSPAWPKTIAMGMSAVPLILEELKKEPRWWMLQVLGEITGENPCPRKHAGRYSQLIEDWLRWGKERGHIPAK